MIKDGDESAYRQEVEQLAVWCSLNNLELNTLKTVEMIVDFKRNPPALSETVLLCHHGDCPVFIYNCLVWFGSATKTDIRRLQRTVRTPERITGAHQPSLQEVYTSRVRKRAKKVTLDPSHPAHSLFELLPSSQRYRSLNTKTTRDIISFYPQANKT